MTAWCFGNTNSPMNPTKQKKHAVQIAKRKEQRVARNIDKGIPRRKAKTNDTKPTKSNFTARERAILTVA